MDRLTLEKFSIALSQARGVGNVLLKEVWEQYDQNIEKIYRAYEQKAFPEKLQKLVSNLNFEMSYAPVIGAGLKYVCLWQAEYPTNLREIADPPFVLYYVGDLSQARNPSLTAVVGSRRMSMLGKQLTHKLVRQLNELHIPIVSGLAFGVDFEALDCASRSSIPSIAVLASPSHIPTPVGNIGLYNRIVENGGAIISEAYPTDKLVAGHFPRRNRLIAGLAKDTIVIEGAEDSGALITARLAQDYNRSVWAVPYHPGHSAQGTNLIIKQQVAAMITDVTDIYPNAIPSVNDADLVLEAEQPILARLRTSAYSLEELTQEFPKFDLLSLLLRWELEGFVERVEGKYIAKT